MEQGKFNSSILMSFCGLALFFMFLSLAVLASQPYYSPDFDGDEFVDFNDFARFAINWQNTGSGLDGDFDAGGAVDYNDLEHFALYWLEDVIYPPVAQDQNVFVTQGHSVNIVLQASDDNNDVLDYFIVSYPSEGPLIIDGNAVTYSPFAAFDGNDSFEFVAYDGKYESNIATVSVVVRPDSDGDGLSDYDEINGTFGYVTDPYDPNSDSDTMPDGWEIEHGLNPTVNDASGDPDNDNFTNSQEYQAGTNPQNPDSDGDGLKDGDEYSGTLSGYGPIWPYNNSYPSYYYTPFVSQPYDVPLCPLNPDTDSDGVTDHDEIKWGLDPNNPDTDEDGLNDGFEVYFGTYSYEVYHPYPLWDYLYSEEFDDCDLNANSTDTDDDGMLDGWEAPYANEWMDPRYKGSGSFQDIYYDPDYDDMTNIQEHTAGTNPTDWDTDGDERTDSEEYFGAPVSDPTLIDTDGDGLVDGYHDVVLVQDYPEGVSGGIWGPTYVAGELTCQTNLTSAHTDSDGMNDGWEARYWNGSSHTLFDPRYDDGYDSYDVELDGLTNLEESQYNTNPFSGDTDGDGFSDSYEVNTSGTDPTNGDSDNDGALDGSDPDPLDYDTDDDLLPDGWEIDNSLNPNSAAGNDGMDGDPDGDGLINFDELIYGANPSPPDGWDSDDDGTNDGDEVAQGSNPADGGDGGQAPAADKYLGVKLTVGDHSSSESERYNLKVGPITHQAPEFGEVEERVYPFEIGQTYEITIVHQGSNLSEPDYDYTAAVEVNEPDNDWMIILDDPDGILGVHGESDYFYAQGKEAYLTIAGKVEPFRDSGYTEVLDDWPATGGGLARSAKYIFGEDDAIYVQAAGLGVDPDVSENIFNAVKVTSESGGEAYLTLEETGPNTQIFRNSEAEGELLYLSNVNRAGPVEKIKVDDEELLTFSIRTPPTGESFTYKKAVEIMVDRAEVGVEWQSNYGAYDIYPTLNTADECAQGFLYKICTQNQLWYAGFDYGDLESMKYHWASSWDSIYADSVDIAVWCGHGTAESETPRALRFFVDLVGGEKQPPEKLLWSEIDWGDKDLDWVVLNTCRFLKGNDSELKQMASGVHLICGYETDMTVFAAAGDYFADKLDEMSIKEAWHKQCWRYQPSGNTSRVFGASDCMNDSLGASGPIQTSRDPNESSTYIHEDYTK